MPVEGGGETVAEATTIRRLFDPGIERRTVEHPPAANARASAGACSGTLAFFGDQFGDRRS